MKFPKINLPKPEKLLPINVGIIVALLGVYIITLNFAVSENFRKGEIDREIKVARQDIQEKEEIFISNLTDFYDQYAASFDKKDISKQEFVSRESNFALSVGQASALR